MVMMGRTSKFFKLFTPSFSDVVMIGNIFLFGKKNHSSNNFTGVHKLNSF